MAEPWVCGDCRSLNSAKATRCYRCHVPRKTAEMDAAAAASTTASPLRQERTVAAHVERLGTTYRPTWWMAIIVVLLIVAATLVNVYAFLALADEVARDPFITDEIVFQQLVDLSVLGTTMFFVGVLAWSVWIAFVVRNPPALVARWTRFGWFAAFIGAWVPILCAKRPYSVVRDVIATLSDQPTGASLIAAAWWLCILGYWLGGGMVVFWRTLVGADRTPLQTTAIATQFGLLFFVPAAIFAIGVVVSIERLQRQALRHRDTTVLMADASTTS
jgi:hypothetical protein